MILNTIKWHFLVLILPFQFFGFTSGIAQPTHSSPTPIQFESDGNQIQGWFFKGETNTPRPVVLILQGSIGLDGDILGLGHALSTHGYHAVTFNYPGSWQSEGARSDKSALRSVHDAIHYLKSLHHDSNKWIDTTKIVLIGYSYGGGMALLAAAADSTIQTVISIAGGDLSVRARQLKEDQIYRNQFEMSLDRIASNSTVIRGTTGKEYVANLIEDGHEFSLMDCSNQLLQKNILFITGWRDTMVRMENHILPLYRKLMNDGAEKIDIAAFDTDHSLENVQSELHDLITKWIDKQYYRTTM